MFIYRNEIITREICSHFFHPKSLVKVSKLGLVDVHPFVELLLPISILCLPLTSSPFNNLHFSVQWFEIPYCLLNCPQS